MIAESCLGILLKALKKPLICPQGRPSTSPDDFKTAQDPQGSPRPPLIAIWSTFPCLQLLPCNLQPLACEWPRRDARSVNNSIGILRNSMRILRIPRKSMDILREPMRILRKSIGILVKSIGILRNSIVIVGKSRRIIRSSIEILRNSLGIP